MVPCGGIILCAAKDQCHVHGACHSDPFHVVLAGENGNQFCVSVYSSDTETWGNVLSLTWLLPNNWAFSPERSGILIGNSVFWLFFMDQVKILKFDLDDQNLASIDVPADVFVFDAYHHNKCQVAITPADGGGLNFIILEGFTVHVWKRISNGSGLSRWMLGNTFELSNLLSLTPSGDKMPVLILASDEDGNVMFKLADGVTVMVHLGTLQFKKLIDNLSHNRFHPFASFCTAGT